MNILWLSLLVAVAAPVGVQIIHAPDAGMGERFSSLEVPTKAGAPFQATVVTAWKYRSTTHWNKHTIFSRRTIARDSAGHVFQERRMFSPDGDHKATTVSELDYYDPAAGTVLVYDQRTTRCRTQSYISTDDPQPLQAEQTVNGVLIRREGLGATIIQGLQALGSRESLTGPAATQSSTVTEFWYSPQLDLNVIMKRTNANGETQTFTVENIDQHEPDRALFQPPAACNGKR